MKRHFKQDFNKKYLMVSVNERNEIIKNINLGLLCSECVTGIKNNWWSKKHHPEEDMPKNIYLSGDGTIEEVYKSFIKRTNIKIEYSEFINYTRELIKQGIMK
jgi:hypothetical protein